MHRDAPLLRRVAAATVDHQGGVGELANAAKGDRQFPRSGSPDEVRKHLNAMQASGEMFEAVEDAEVDGLCYRGSIGGPCRKRKH